ncbi:hypothetical protein [Erythrobacter sp. F6033]|uniref:hypothetical protein n=1 Tax=Erythrobacter sp. F6033 TaxID=2926401 RepID=UPI001FF2F87F|nr:hypothetical protein [Erythrobacter sp. F6033]MCK0129631.1 hypothetical protein [Erythrobacter sp. F6033]
MSGARTQTKCKPVLPWFVVFFAFLIGSLVAIDLLDVKNPLIANGLILLSMIPLAKAGLNASANAASRGEVGNATRNYLIRMLVVSVAYIGAVFAASQLIDDGDPVTVLSVIIALVPGLAIALYFWAMGKYLAEQQDEFLRMLMVRQALIATAIAFSAAAIWGFLESFGQVPHIDAYWWPIVWFLGIGIGAIFNKVQYGTVGEL